jgi:hypothetical protein
MCRSITERSEEEWVLQSGIDDSVRTVSVSFTLHTVSNHRP